VTIEPIVESRAPTDGRIEQPELAGLKEAMSAVDFCEGTLIFHWAQ
jgi:hypothetical protein